MDSIACKSFNEKKFMQIHDVSNVLFATFKGIKILE